MVKHDFLNLKSCNDDKEGLTKTLREGKETSVRQPGPKPRRMHVVERGDRKRVSACTLQIDRYKEICMGKFDTHRLRIWIKPRTKTVKQVAWNT